MAKSREQLEREIRILERSVDSNARLIAKKQEELDLLETYEGIRRRAAARIKQTMKGWKLATDVDVKPNSVGPLGGISHQVSFTVDGHRVICNVYCDERTDQELTPCTCTPVCPTCERHPALKGRGRRLVFEENY